MNNKSIFTDPNQLDTSVLLHSTSERGNRSSHEKNIKENVQLLEEQHKGYKEELQKSKRLYEKFFLRGTDTKITPNKRIESKEDRYSTVESN